MIDRIVSTWGQALANSNAGISTEQLRELLSAMRADQLLAASLAGSLDRRRNVVAAAIVSEPALKPSLLRAKALGDANQDLVYVPVIPCRLVKTRGSFPAVYQGRGAFMPGQVRTYTLVGGNGVCLSQLPANVTPSAVQMQVYGIPTTPGSGDIEVLPQGGTFGSTASLVYLGNNAFTSSAVTSSVNLANKQISVQVRGGGAHVAMDVVGYFRAPQGGTGNLVWVDANGTVIGRYLDDSHVVVTVNGSPFILGLSGYGGTAMGATWASVPELFYQQLDCVGAPYMTHASARLGASKGARQGHGVLPKSSGGAIQYQLLATGPNIGPMTYQSSLTGLTGLTCQNQPEPVPLGPFMWPTRPPIDLPFVPPFFVEGL